MSKRWFNIRIAADVIIAIFGCFQVFIAWFVQGFGTSITHMYLIQRLGLSMSAPQVRDALSIARHDVDSYRQLFSVIGCILFFLGCYLFTMDRRAKRLYESTPEA